MAWGMLIRGRQGMVSRIQLSFCFFVILLPACGRGSKEEPTLSVDAGGQAPVAVSVAPSAPPPPAVVAADGAETDAGGGAAEVATDAGLRRRSLRTRREDAGAGVAAASEPSAAPLQAPPPSPSVSARKPSAAMGDDGPYGGPSVSSSAVLEKRKLPGDDPWGSASR